MPLLLALPLLVILAVMVSYAMAYLSHVHASGFVGWFLGSLGKVVKLTEKIVEFAVPLGGWIAHEMGKAFHASYKLASSWLDALAMAYVQTGEELFNLARDVSWTLAWLVSTEIPHLIAALPNAVTHVVHSTTTRVVKIERTIVQQGKVTKAAIEAAIAHELPGVIGRDLPFIEWLRKHFKELARIATGAGAIAIPGILAWERVFGRKVDRDIAAIHKRLRHLERVFGATAASAVFLAAIAKLGLGWIRCPNMKRLGRGICGLPSHFVDDLLGLLLDFLVLADICQVVGIVSSAFAEVEGPIATFVGDVGGALCHGDYPEHPFAGLRYSTAAPEQTALAL